LIERPETLQPAAPELIVRNGDYDDETLVTLFLIFAPEFDAVLTNTNKRP
jgi:hypothetical protein